jgi:hypothetical protein
MDLTGLTVRRIAVETGYPDGDVSVCLKQTRPYKPLRLKIEQFFCEEFKRQILSRDFNQKEKEILLTLLDLSADEIATRIKCSEARVNAWMVGGPTSPKMLEKIATYISSKIKGKLFVSALDADSQRAPKSIAS